MMILSQKTKFKLGDRWRMSGSIYRATNIRMLHHFATCASRKLQKKLKNYWFWAAPSEWWGRVQKVLMTKAGCIEIVLSWSTFHNVTEK